ncbi:tetratricopeptide repeat protein [Coraliomargarita sp. SDUM461004]|uniref:Tetratricopeptide repeat protein n=1 Tax=Thalassobacterium sedimentorum TaxID=3041258 RepID=A0ABU1AJP6_9BACT|nr:tetratricopeptide repeat protein [Coraliomargarita sp. SDUM461004]MDQ8195016.1 tetratricopeptide repeat protein [Coraliomargarita sp. SDUM461004]
MSDTSLQDQIDDATLDFTLGDGVGAISKLTALSEAHADCFGVWHALTEIYFAEGDYDAALQAGERAHALCPDDIHINTSLSRIWVERGDKDRAEHFGAQARMLGWKDELKSPPQQDDI